MWIFYNFSIKQSEIGNVLYHRGVHTLSAPCIYFEIKLLSNYLIAFGTDRLVLFQSFLATIASTDDENTDDLKSQVDFLNSVIVDMQRKNDELKAKLELLESAGILETIDIADMAMLNGIDTNRVAPRLFCDICDEFDIHDTEDCPTQG